MVGTILLYAIRRNMHENKWCGLFVLASLYMAVNLTPQLFFLMKLNLEYSKPDNDMLVINRYVIGLCA